ncbi:hypothetical protein BD324DRAFT_615701 [Kockovaella imperatae]|uniref:Uncharacterized protein n=1 Tax=Kockovaella imperatae TaxID=4999 RepID=A0A1Y1US02_9TREE|nr:hypothetical protein BD324DRAFT_615701 [Kockovaella imperatae]ORX39965.1 hypothetical protein BD324DRAFT_615701 [Kockovaella imperatae]
MLLSLALVALAGLLPSVSAYGYCGYGYYNDYDCNNGLSIGARIGIGIGIAVGVLLLFALCSYWRRKQLRRQFNKYRPPTLPFTNNNNSNNNNSSNPYANNPPPPAQAGSYYANGNQGSNWQNNQYGNNPPPPANVYQPSMAGAYGSGAKEMSSTGGRVTTPAAQGHEHGYEWEQAREAERQEREQANVQSPPGYDVASNTTGSTHYAPPSGPPPKRDQ